MKLLTTILTIWILIVLGFFVCLVIGLIYCAFTYEDTGEDIEEDIEKVEQKHGHWIVPYCHCSICGQTSSRQGNYCDNCGAKMDEEVQLWK